MLLLQRSIGNRRRRRPLLPLGLRVVSLDSPGLVAVFLVGNRSSSVARAAGPSVACGSHLLRRGGARVAVRLLLSVVGCRRRRRPRRPRRVAVVGHFVAVVLRLRSSSAFEPFVRAAVAPSALSLWPHTSSECALIPGFAGASEFERFSE